MEAVIRQRQQRRANHGARHTTAHFPSRPKNHTAFLGLYGKMRRHPPCAVVFLPRVSIFPIEKTCRATPRGCQWLWLTAKTALVPPPARLPNRERYHTVAQHQHRTSTHVPTNLWQPGQSGNPAGRTRGSRNKLSEEVICALLRDFRKHGEKAIAKVRREQPGVYLRCLTLLIPREHKVEQSNVIKNLSDQQLEAMIEYIETSLAAQAGASAKMIGGTIEPISVEARRGPLLDSPKPNGSCPAIVSSSKSP